MKQNRFSLALERCKKHRKEILNEELVMTKEFIKTITKVDIKTKVAGRNLISSSFTLKCIKTAPNIRAIMTYAAGSNILL